MIRTDAGLRITRESLANLEEALLDLTRNRVKYHPRTFALLAAPIADEIRARRAEIDEYIGLAGLPCVSSGTQGVPGEVPREGTVSVKKITWDSAAAKREMGRHRTRISASENRWSDASAAEILVPAGAS
jgi:hypothetical protein